MVTNAELEKQVKDLEAKVEAMGTTKDPSSVSVDTLHRALWKFTRGQALAPDDLPNPGVPRPVLEHEARKRGFVDLDDAGNPIKGTEDVPGYLRAVKRGDG